MLIEFLTDGICPVCKQPGASVTPIKGDCAIVKCPHCNNYQITIEAANALRNLSLIDRPRLSGAVREASERGRFSGYTEITTENIDAYLSNAPQPRDIPGKVRKLLASLARNSIKPGAQLAWPMEHLIAALFAEDKEEAKYLLRYAEDQKWVIRDHPDGKWGFTLTPAGWEETQQRPRIESPTGFVAMRFHRSTEDAWLNGIRPAIEQDCHYNAVKIDAMQFNGDIIDKLMAEIRESRFVVADLTGHRRGVYFEAGFAKGLGIDVIWTCYAPRAGRTHFDAEHFNQIRWVTPADLREKLSTRIRATNGLGPVEHPAV